jgi:hypothetical protein
LSGLSDLILQLGIASRDHADQIAHAVLSYPLIAGAGGRLGTVIHREEFTKLLLDLATPDKTALMPDAKAALVRMLHDNGIPDPAATLKQIRAIALQLEVAQPSLANHVRQTLAIVKTTTSDYVARINAWFDPTIDRVSERFTKYTHWITLFISAAVVLVVQLDTIAVIDRLSIDDQFRTAFVDSAVKDYSAASTKSATDVQPLPYYDLISKAGLITLPSGNWLREMSDLRKYPGLLLSILLLSLGAPFWYNVLKDLIGLRSSLARKDDSQRSTRQGIPDGQTAAAAAPGS